MTPYVLILAIYTALGGQFDRMPHKFATFESRELCRHEAQKIEGRSDIGSKYVAMCVPASVEQDWSIYHKGRLQP